jgi:hypothetical protein
MPALVFFEDDPRPLQTKKDFESAIRTVKASFDAAFQLL